MCSNQESPAQRLAALQTGAQKATLHVRAGNRRKQSFPGKHILDSGFEMEPHKGLILGRAVAHKGPLVRFHVSAPVVCVAQGAAWHTKVACGYTELIFQDQPIQVSFRRPGMHTVGP